jgi:hypothetical protein
LTDGRVPRSYPFSGGWDRNPIRQGTAGERVFVHSCTRCCPVFLRVHAHRRAISFHVLHTSTPRHDRDTLRAAEDAKVNGTFFFSLAIALVILCSYFFNIHTFIYSFIELSMACNVFWIRFGCFLRSKIFSNQIDSIWWSREWSTTTVILLMSSWISYAELEIL